MNGRIFRLNIPPHQAVQELLPWFAAAQLGPEETSRVEEHLRSCEECRKDLDWERQLRAMTANNQGVAAAGTDVDRGLAQILPMLGAQQAPAPDIPAPATRQAHWLGWAAAVQGVVIVGLLALLARQDAAMPHYHLLGGGGSGAANLVVVFRPETSEHELRRIVRAHGGRVVDGPTVTDAYLISVPPVQRSAALRALRTEPAVTLAEDLQAGGTP